jgi:predicted ATPase/DNA-binding SARP family transcriptional activator
VEIRLLGSLEVRDDDGQLLSLGGPRLQKLLIALALRCGEVLPDDNLIEAVWGDDIPARSLNALQRQVSTLRRTLGAADVVQRRGTGYALALDKSAIDIFRFESLAARGHEAMRGGDVGHARELLDQALALWRGEALADVAYEEFAQVEIARLNEARLVATEARIDADLALGREAGLISELEQLVLAYPLREHLRAQLMLALTRAGRQADALRSYQSARAVLGEELGLEPSQELRALESAILQQDETVVRSDAAASPRPRANLRIPLTTLIGRRADLDALRPVLHEQRLVTLVGPGGVGKSRLAIEAARESLESDTIDVWLVELADVADPDGVVAAIMAALDLSRTGSSAADARRLIEFLKGRRALLVLDNCEHVVASTARITQDLLESCASLRIWATSREGLAIRGEVLWPVPPLSLDDAVALFIERGRAADPISDLDADFESTHNMLANICTRLDGLPLAIELAAARLRAMPISEVAAGLEDRFRLLNRGARTARPRQQTLRAVVDWSYDLLFDDERRVFDRLSVFGGSCTSAAARAVCADDEITGDDVAELVTRLADKSLITVEKDEVDGYPRFRMLQTLVDYGRECLEISGEAERVHVAHVRYYADFAVRSLAALQGEKQRGWLRAVTANFANLRAALDAAVRDGDAETAQSIAGCLGWYWWFTGRTLEGSQWLALAAGCHGAVRNITRARLLAWTAFTGAPGLVRWVEPQGSLPRGEQRSPGRLTDEETDVLCAEALALYREAGVPDELAGVETALAVTYWTRVNHVRAGELLADAERLLASLAPAPRVRAMQAFIAARRALVEGRDAEAEEAFRVSIELLDAVGADVACSFALRYAGRLAARRGDHASCIEVIERALKLARGLGLSGLANALMTDLGESLLAGGEVERAREILRYPLAAAREVGFLPGIAENLASLAVVEWCADDAERAAQLAREALDIALAVDDQEIVAHCLALLGSVAARRGDLEDARAHHAHALQLARGADEPRRTALALVGLAYVALRLDDGRGAARLLGAAATLRQERRRARAWVFAAGAQVDADEVLALATTAAGAEAVSSAFAEGAADPQRVVADVMARPAG